MWDAGDAIRHRRVAQTRGRGRRPEAEVNHFSRLVAADRLPSAWAYYSAQFFFIYLIAHVSFAQENVRTWFGVDGYDSKNTKSSTKGQTSTNDKLLNNTSNRSFFHRIPPTQELSMGPNRQNISTLRFLIQPLVRNLDGVFLELAMGVKVPHHLSTPPLYITIRRSNR